jgi:hypothetical protein
MNRHKYRFHETFFPKTSNLARCSLVIGQIENKPGVSRLYLTAGMGDTVPENGPRGMLDNKESWK